MNSETKLLTSTCPFCLYGCKLSLIEIKRGTLPCWNIEYDKNSSVNNGRLCARGNAAKQIIDDHKRLSSPLLNNKKIDWNQAITHIKSGLKTLSSKEIAVTYDINNTIEELNAVFSFSQKLNIDAVASSYLEPEHLFNYQLDNIKFAQLSDIEQSKVFLMIGDVFGKTPVMSKPILDAKYTDRNNRLYYIDSVKTKLAGFANKFIWTNPNTEPLVLLAMIVSAGKPARDILGDKNYNLLKKNIPKILEICGILQSDIDEIVQSLNSIQKGVIFASTDYGKTDDPLLLAGLTQLLSLVLAGDKKLCFPALASLPNTKFNFSDIIRQIKENKIKALINFGDIFPFYYPQLNNELNNLKLFVTTSTYLNSSQLPLLTLAVPSILEKTGTISTLWGKDNVKPLANLLNGTRSITDIIELIENDSSKSKPRLNYRQNINIDAIIDRAVNYLENYQDNNLLTVTGEESAFEYRGIFENSAHILKINFPTARKYELNQGDSVKLNINNIIKDYSVQTVNYLKDNTVMISTNIADNRGLFPVKTDEITKEIIITSAQGYITK